MKKEEKPPKPPPIKAEVIDHFISLHMGNDRYEVFRKGAIVDIEPVTFRNLERKGRVKAATDVGKLGFQPDSADVASSPSSAKKRNRQARSSAVRVSQDGLTSEQEKTAPSAGDDAVPC